MKEELFWWEVYTFISIKLQFINFHMLENHIKPYDFQPSTLYIRCDVYHETCGLFFSNGMVE